MRLANLLVNTSMAQGAFQIGDLQQAATKLSEEQAVLREQVGALSAPTALESKARALGMIPTDSPVFLSVPGGKVIGQPAPAGVAAEKKKDMSKVKFTCPCCNDKAWAKSTMRLVCGECNEEMQGEV